MKEKEIKRNMKSLRITSQGYPHDLRPMKKNLCKAFLETMVLKESLAIIFGKHITEYMT